MEKLLLSIAQEPLLGIAERYQKLCLSGKAGNQCKEKLIKLGMVKEVSIKTGKARIKLLELAEKGMQELKNYGYSKSWRHGGVEHQYWVAQVKKKLIDAGYHPKEEYPIGNGETVDLAIIGKNKKIAVEIETGKSDAIKNIRKCLDAGFEVLSLAINRDVLKKTNIGIEQFSGSELEKIRTKVIKNRDQDI